MKREKERETEWEVGHMDCTNGCRRANHRSSEELFHLVMFGGHHMGPPSPSYVSWSSLSLSLLPFPFLSLSFSSLFLKCMQTRKLLLSTQKKIIILMMNERPFVFKDLGKCDRDLFFLFFFFPNDFCGCGNNLFDDMDKICVI